VDESNTAGEIDRLIPTLAIWEESIRTAEPDLAQGEILDRALQAAVSSLRYDLSKETVAYLRWKVEKARAEAAATVNATIEARRRRLAGDASVDAPTDPCRADAPAALYRDSSGRLWRVREIAAPRGPWARGASCLLFESDDMIRRVWHYPTGWDRLSDADLEALSWRR
jgi:hypothetical protein